MKKLQIKKDLFKKYLTNIRKSAYIIGEEVDTVGLRELRKSRNMSQRELANMCGINYRSLQDYEQGHKNLMSANGDILLRLTTVLGCTISELLLADHVTGSSLHAANTVDIASIQSQQFYCEKYNVAGRWICGNNSISTMFYFNGKQYSLPFSAVFTPRMLPCLAEAAALQIEEKIDDILFHENEFEEW